jgi:hypothetical protein
MRPKTRALLSGLVALIALASCSSEGVNLGIAGVAFSAARDSVTGRTRAAPEMPPFELTSETLREMGGKGIVARIDSPSFTSPMSFYTAKDGVDTYTIGGILTVSLRSGVLVATRGLGDDLMAADVPSAARLASGSGTHARRMHQFDGATSVIPLDATCNLSTSGTETLALAGQSYPTRIIVETCDSAVGRFENRYWIGKGGKILRSRQWISIGAGYADILSP